MSDELECPPYPKSMTTMEGLYECVTDLADWVNKQKDWLNAEVERLNAPEEQYTIKHPLIRPNDFHFKQNFQRLPITYLHATFMTLRSIRESYDDLIRNYETLSEWNSDICIVRRMTLVRVAYDLVSFVCLDKEKQEAFLHAKSKLGFKRFKEMIREFASSINMDDDDDDDDDELDNLFNPKD